MTEFKLPDMTCGHCVSLVTKALKSADAACEVDVDLRAQTARVRSVETREVLADALFDAGYPPA